MGLVLTCSCATTPSPPVVAPVAVLTPATPDELKSLLAAPGAKATLVNVWATWCDPCVREFPDVLRAGRESEKRGVRTLFVSADFERDRPAAEAFLIRYAVEFPTYVKVGDDQAFIDSVSKSWSGSIPTTMIFDAQGNLRFLREGEIDYAGITAALDAILD